MGEINLYGIYVPILLVHAIFAYISLYFMMPILHKAVAKGWIIVPNIFYFCVYVALLWIIHWGYIMCFA